MAYGSSKPPGPKLDVFFDDLLPYYTVLKDGTVVGLQRIVKMLTLRPAAKVQCSRHHDAAGARDTVCTDRRTFRSIHNLLNYEIKQGNSYPFEACLPEETFDEYFFGYDAFVMRTVDTSPPHTRAPNVMGCDGNEIDVDLPDPQFVGCFYVKPNYPGRSSHICNGGFLVSPFFRGQGAGLILGERFRIVAQRLGYRGCVFNLVFHDNPASGRLWEKLSFTKVGVIPEAGRHPIRLGRGSEDDPHHYVAATVWHLTLSKPLKTILMPWEMAHMATIRKVRAEAAEQAKKAAATSESKL